MLGIAKEKMSITLKDVIKSIKRHLFLILVITLIGGVVAGLFSYKKGDGKYRSEAKFECKSISVIGDFKVQVLSDYVIGKTLDIISENHPDLKAEDLRQAITVSALEDTKYAIISVEHKEKVTAYYICSVLSDVVLEELTGTVSRRENEPTLLQTVYTGKSLVRTILVGALLGLAFSVATSVVIASHTRIINSRSDIERYFDLRVLGAIPKKNKQKALKLLSVNAVECTNRDGIKKIAVTSVGKIKNRSCLANKIGALIGIKRDYNGLSGKDLAVALADSGKKTIYIDALNIKSEEYGLTDYLKDEQKKNPVLVTDNKNLFVVKGGTKVENSVELLSSDKLKKLLDNLAKQSDYVIIDMPSIGNNVDAIAIHNMVDSYILSVKLKINGVSQLNNAIGTLKQLSANVSGVILENANKSDVFGGRILYR